MVLRKTQNTCTETCTGGQKKVSICEHAKQSFFSHHYLLITVLFPTRTTVSPLLPTPLYLITVSVSTRISLSAWKSPDRNSHLLCSVTCRMHSSFVLSRHNAGVESKGFPPHFTCGPAQRWIPEKSPKILCEVRFSFSVELPESVQ